MRTIEEELTDKLGESGYADIRRKLCAITRDVEAQNPRRDVADLEEGKNDES
jgi:hypothetical protein